MSKLRVTSSLYVFLKPSFFTELISSAPDPNNISGSVDSTDDNNLSPSPFNSSPLAFSPFGRSQSSQDDDEEIGVEDYVIGDGEEGYGNDFGEDGDEMFMMDEEVWNSTADVSKIFVWSKNVLMRSYFLSNV